MNSRPSSIRVFGSSLVTDPFTPQFRAYRYGGSDAFVPPVEPKPAPVVRVCAAEGCETKPHAKGLCSTHYRKELRGVPLEADGRRRAFEPSACGTVRGYSRHLHYGVELCQPCRDAKNTYDRARRAGRKSS